MGGRGTGNAVGTVLRFRGLLLLSILAAALIGISAFSARDVARVAHFGRT